MRNKENKNATVTIGFNGVKNKNLYEIGGDKRILKPNEKKSGFLAYTIVAIIAVIFLISMIILVFSINRAPQDTEISTVETTAFVISESEDFEPFEIEIIETDVPSETTLFTLAG